MGLGEILVKLYFFSYLTVNIHYSVKPYSHATFRKMVKPSAHGLAAV
jgi:hypothetical protein